MSESTLPHTIINFDRTLRKNSVLKQEQKEQMLRQFLAAIQRNWPSHFAELALAGAYASRAEGDYGICNGCGAPIDE